MIQPLHINIFYICDVNFGASINFELHRPDNAICASLGDSVGKINTTHIRSSNCQISNTPVSYRLVTFLQVHIFSNSMNSV